MDKMNKSLKAAENHLNNINKLTKGEKVSYDYLDTCWICGKDFSLWDKLFSRVFHSFEGNSHKKCIK